MASSAQVAAIVTLVLIVLVVFVVLTVVAKLCFAGGTYKKNTSQGYMKPTLVRYWKHEHSLLGVLWQKPPYPTAHPGEEAVELDRKRKLLLLVLMFLLNFMIIGFISLFTPSYPSCPQAKDALENALLDRAGPTYVPFIVGYNENLRSYLYSDSGSNSFIKYKSRAQSSNVGVAEERPCWQYCKAANATEPERDFISRLLIFSRSLTDKRLECEQIQDSGLRDSLVCFDYRWNDQTDCDSSVFVSLSSTEFILRAILVVFVVLPLVAVYKQLLKCTESDTVSCMGQFFAYPFIIIIFVLCFILAWVLAISLQGEVVGDFTISFLFNFLLTLAGEFPKLGFWYLLYRGKRLERLYLEHTDGSVVDGVLLVDSLSSSSGQSVVDLDAFEKDVYGVGGAGHVRSAPGFQSPYSNQQQFHAAPGTPYGAPPPASPYGDTQYGAAPMGHPYGVPAPQYRG